MLGLWPQIKHYQMPEILQHVVEVVRFDGFDILESCLFVHEWLVPNYYDNYTNYTIK